MNDVQRIHLLALISWNSGLDVKYESGVDFHLLFPVQGRQFFLLSILMAKCRQFRNSSSFWIPGASPVHPHPSWSRNDPSQSKRSFLLRKAAICGRLCRLSYYWIFRINLIKMMQLRFLKDLVWIMPHLFAGETAVDIHMGHIAGPLILVSRWSVPWDPYILPWSLSSFVDNRNQQPSPDKHKAIFPGLPARIVWFVFV